MNKRFKKNKLGVNSDHSRSMLRNLATSLIIFESIETTKPRTREVRSFVERLITIAKKGDLTSKNRVFDKLRSRKAADKLIEKIAPRMQDRPSGFVSIIKAGNSKGDNTELYRISFVDFEPVDRRKKKRAKVAAKTTKTAENKGIMGKVKGFGRKGREASAQSQVAAGSMEGKAKSRSGI